MTRDRIRPSRVLRLLPLLVLAAAAPPSPWPDAAVQDLTAMHDLIRDNHPGPVDPANPGFRDWLDGGEATLLPQARAARSLHDYQLVLRDYANGFADGHLGVVMTDSAAHLWPGFLVRADRPDAPLRVSALATGPDAPVGVQLGSVVESCGGITARTLLEERVLRPALNPHVPQRLRLASALLTVTDADAPSDHWPGCTVSSHGRSRAVPLRWRPITQAALAREQARSSGIALPQTGLRHVGDVWLVSLPSFDPRDAAATTRLQASARNAAAIREDSAMLQRQGQTEIAGHLDELAGRMDAALLEHQTFLREQGDPPGPAPDLATPFLNPVYLLTTPHCASACLDFVDLMNGLPGAVRVGLETSSDADYFELAAAPLPSGHATLRYAMKAYRQRKRAANASYKPAIAWQGGEMNDLSIAKWIDTLR